MSWEYICDNIYLFYILYPENVLSVGAYLDPTITTNAMQIICDEA